MKAYPKGVSPHPVMALPSPEEMMDLGEAGTMQLLAEREKAIAQEKSDPYRYGFEPPIWWVLDCLYGWPWVQESETRRVLDLLGFPAFLWAIMVNGGNRAAKSRYAARTYVRVLMWMDKAMCHAFHMSEKRSIQDMQPLVWDYLPPEIKLLNMTRSETTYITYKSKQGFGDASFMLPNRSLGIFANYKMDKDTALEGLETNYLHFDELVPVDWVETAMYRLPTRGGRMLVTFTPVNGYNATVRLFREGAQTVRENTAFLVPKDDGEPDLQRALDLTAAELREVIDALDHDRDAMSVPCRPEDCRAWVEGRPSQPEVPEDRRFEMVPRVQRCFDSRKAIVYFHSSDNPFGGAPAVALTSITEHRDKRLERFYGLVNRTMGTRFPKFNRQVHVIADANIPERGTDYHFVDPASGRNFFMKWFRVTEDAVYLRREWPGNYEIPGVGFPGEWAMPSGEKPDGRPGDAQRPFGWGLKRYKQEIARLEGWSCYRPGEHPEDAIREWDPDAGEEPSREIIERRYIDSRAASNPRVENDRPRTLLTDFEELGLYFELTPGVDISEGVAAINDALDYNPEEDLSFFNRPKFYVAESCVNSIFALETWTGLDGNKGACKDPVDLDRYFFLSECEYIDPDTPVCEGGGHY